MSDLKAVRTKFPSIRLNDFVSGDVLESSEDESKRGRARTPKRRPKARVLRVAQGARPMKAVKSPLSQGASKANTPMPHGGAVTRKALETLIDGCARQEEKITENKDVQIIWQ